MDVWIVLIEDERHGPTVMPFSDEDGAFKWARTVAGHDGVTGDELGGHLADRRIVLYLPITERGDRIFVFKRTVDG